MKAMSVMLFFGLFFAAYGLINYYIFLHGWQAFPAGSPLRTPYLIIFLFLALAFIGGRFLERVWLSPVSEALVWIGSFWLAAILYFFLAAVLLDLIRLAHSLIPFYPAAVTSAYDAVKFRIAAGITGLVVLVLVAGHINTLYPQVRHLVLTVQKKVGGEKTLTIVAVSDIHLGTIIGERRLQSIVDRINALEPDLVLLPGDIVDEDLAPVVRENLGETLKNIRAKYGVFAITGNHEYIGGAEAACRYLTEHGITILRDSVARLRNGIAIVGREDISRSQFAGKKRKPLEEIMAGVDPTFPILLMDHQPFRLDEGVRSGADLQLSGHTHHGQLWPLNLITNAVYEVSWGYKRKGGTHIYVSSGAGTWGPPVRTGNRPEIVHITLHFEDPPGRL